MEGSRARARPRHDILLRREVRVTITGATGILRADMRRTAQSSQHNIGALAVEIVQENWKVNHVLIG